ncbi:MAG: S46 family peptidase [Rhodothermia bacterium]|nr:S46 family peptidase [Rhodothermia bacterium]
MRPHLLRATPLVLVLLLGCTTARDTAVITERPTKTEPVAVAPDTVTVAEIEVPQRPEVIPGRFDMGKMWTFDNPPTDYLKEAYDFSPPADWFAKARLGALRFATYCSASFVSPNGLVATNHHCGRESVSGVSDGDEALLDDGFYARHVEDERKVKDLYVEQLIAIEDVTEDVYSTLDGVFGDEGQSQAREDQAERIQKRMTNAAKATDSTLAVQVIALYHGGQYSAYTFRRYDDVRLVMAPELQIGFFGGDPDNFTYPRHNLDYAFFRVYGTDGLPLSTDHYFEWSFDGVDAGDLVFVVGSPASTSRLSTVDQLEFERDHALPSQIELFRNRAAVLESFIDDDPEAAEEHDLRNTYFSLKNSIKSWEGQLAGLRDPILMARKEAWQEKLMAGVSANDSLKKLYGGVVKDIAAMQKAKEAVATQSAAFTYFGADVLESHIILRALYGFLHDFLKIRGAPAEQVKKFRDDGLKVEDWPAGVEKAFIAARLGELEKHLGSKHPIVRGILGGRTPDSVAAEVVMKSALVDSAGFAGLLDSGYLTSGDVTVELIEALAPAYLSLGQQLTSFASTEENLNARLARAQFAIYGKSIPPDATFSPRISDGVVAGYAYNGTVAPAFTTLFGLLERHFAHRGREEWALPEKWLNLSRDVDLSTPMNFVSTNDISGGSSGSPVLNRDLQVVGLAFDSNMEALPNEYLFRDERGRTVSVDGRAIVESLDHVYDADRIVQELRTGTFYETEAAADEVVLSTD